MVDIQLLKSLEWKNLLKHPSFTLFILFLVLATFLCIASTQPPKKGQDAVLAVGIIAYVGAFIDLIWFYYQIQKAYLIAQTSQFAFETSE